MSRHRINQLVNRSGPRLITFTVMLLACSLGTGEARADVTPAQVLVVYNSAATGAEDVLSAYLAAHPDIPPENLLDLANPALNVADVSYANFKALIRDPIRDYLNLPGDPTPSGIVSILLLRPFPHRVQDTDNGAVCDNVGAFGPEFSAGDATCASVDAELVLLWQNLDAGEAGGTLDSYADNIIDNPYHRALTPIQAHSRANIQSQRAFMNLGGVAWGLPGSGALTPGDMYLVCRIDANSTDDAIALIQRSQNILVNRALTRILLDEFDTSIADELDDDGLFVSNDPFNAGDDYEETEAPMSLFGWDVRYDATADFITGAEEPATLIAYASYGENHSVGGGGENPPGNGTYIEEFTFAPGAVFNTIESFNARGLNGLGTLFNQEQVADFIGVGGTFAVGNVWEPLSFTVPDNEFLIPRLLQSGRQFAEAAYMSFPVLSWQQVAVGDPLARVIVVDDPANLPGDLDDNGVVDAQDAALFTLLLLDGYETYRAAHPALDPFARADFTGDYAFSGADLPGFVDAYLNSP